MSPFKRGDLFFLGNYEAQRTSNKEEAEAKNTMVSPV